MTKAYSARLAEAVLTHLCQLPGGMASTWDCPLGARLHDVQVLDSLRPP